MIITIRYQFHWLIDIPVDTNCAHTQITIQFHDVTPSNENAVNINRFSLFSQRTIDRTGNLNFLF